MTLSTDFKDQAVLTITQNTERIEACFSELTEDQIWLKPNASSNSMGNLVLHLCGNITQYIISGLGGKEDLRQRDEEFTSAGVSVEELMRRLESTVTDAIQVIQNVPDKELLETRRVQGYHYSGLAIIFHVVEHYSYHLGQIAYFTKLLLDKDLGFYAGRNLNLRNG